MLTVIGTEYNPAHKALEVYISGCKRQCHACHNPEAQAFGRGKSNILWMQENRYKLKTGTFRRVWILGGDLLDQPLHEAVEFMTSLRLAMPLTMELWLWTGAVEELAHISKPLLELFDVVKTGAYRMELPSISVEYKDGDSLQSLVLASSNQHLHDLRGGRSA